MLACHISTNSGTLKYIAIRRCKDTDIKYSCNKTREDINMRFIGISIGFLLSIGVLVISLEET